MVTEIIERYLNGETRRCDARCHNAKQPRCKCICGGRFHGAARVSGGMEKARKKYAEEVEKHYQPESIYEEAH